MNESARTRPFCLNADDNFGNNILDSPREQGVESIFTPIRELSQYTLITILDMNRLYAERFLAISKILGAGIWHTKKEPSGIEAKKDETHNLIILLRELETLCAELGLDVSKLSISDLITTLCDKDTPNNTLQSGLVHIQKSIYNELSLNMVMLIPRSKVKEYYENITPFGEITASAFPSTSFDIEEAGKCFATARFTACVMHLQRVLEIGLKSFGQCLNIKCLETQSKQPSWNMVLDQTRKEIKDRNDTTKTSPAWLSNEEKEFFENLQPLLESIRNPWRNASMHADKIYTEEQAKEIFNAVKAFMRNLSEHLNEKGRFQRKKRK